MVVLGVVVFCCEASSSVVFERPGWGKGDEPMMNDDGGASDSRHALIWTPSLPTHTYYTQAALHAQDEKGAMSSSRGAAARMLTRKGKLGRAKEEEAGCGYRHPLPPSPPSPNTP